MCPYIHIFELNIPVYGIMCILGMLVALGVAVLQCKRYSYPRQEALLAALITLAGGIAGVYMLRPITKIPDVIIHWEEYSKVPVGAFLSWFIGDLVFYGGLIGGTIALILYCRYFKMSITRITDIFAPALPVGHAIGRIGCLLAGCCYGIEVSPHNPLAIIYPMRTDGLAAVAAPAGVPLLAMPLIEAGGNIIIACAVLLFQRKTRTQGLGVAVYGILYSIQRFTLEFFRGDLTRGVYGGISTSQIISLLIFAASILWLFIVLPRRQAAEKPQ